MNIEDREFVTPFHVLVLRRNKILGLAARAQTAGAERFEIRTIGDQRRLAMELMNDTVQEGPPLVIQYAELMALGCLELKPEV